MNNMKIKMFDNPIKTSGYLDDIDLHKVLEKRINAFIFIRTKYEFENKWDYSIEYVEYDMDCCLWVFEYDWFEGQDQVEFLGWIDYPTSLSSDEIKTLYELLKNIES